MEITLQLSDELTAALRHHAKREGRSTHQVALAAIDAYLARTDEDARTDAIAERGATRFANLLHSLRST